MSNKTKSCLTSAMLAEISSGLVSTQVRILSRALYSYTKKNINKLFTTQIMVKRIEDLFHPYETYRERGGVLFEERDYRRLMTLEFPDSSLNRFREKLNEEWLPAAGLDPLTEDQLEVYTRIFYFKPLHRTALGTLRETQIAAKSFGEDYQNVWDSDLSKIPCGALWVHI